jgi:hypothetical protein
MSKGNPIVTARVSRALYAEMQETIAIHNETQTCAEWETPASFVVKAIREMIRKRKAGRKRKSPPSIADSSPPLCHGCDTANTGSSGSNPLGAESPESNRIG